MSYLVFALRRRRFHRTPESYPNAPTCSGDRYVFRYRTTSPPATPECPRLARGLVSLFATQQRRPHPVPNAPDLLGGSLRSSLHNNITPTPSPNAPDLLGGCPVPFTFPRSGRPADLPRRSRARAAPARGGIHPGFATRSAGSLVTKPFTQIAGGARRRPWPPPRPLV